MADCQLVQIGLKADWLCLCYDDAACEVRSVVVRTNGDPPMHVRLADHKPVSALVGDDVPRGPIDDTRTFVFKGVTGFLTARYEEAA